MAKDHRLCKDEGADSAFGPVVDITATYAGVIYSYEHIFRCRGREHRYGLLFERHFIRCIEDKREILPKKVSCEALEYGINVDARTLSFVAVVVCIMAVVVGT